MAQRYTSFLLRCWHLDGDERRIKVEHIGSGEATQVTTLAAALTWIDTQCSAAPGDSRATPGQPNHAAHAAKEEQIGDE